MTFPWLIPARGASQERVERLLKDAKKIGTVNLAVRYHAVDAPCR